MDCDLDLAVVIGKTGKDIARAKALSHLLGYTSTYDTTPGDLQEQEMRSNLGPAQSKDFDMGVVLRPCIVTRDEPSDPYALAISARVDGEVCRRGITAVMHHRFEDVIAHVSQNEALYTGELTGSETTAGCCVFELGRRLHPDAFIEVEVEVVLTLPNRLVRT